MRSPRDCLTCGLCCFSNDPTHIRVFDIDYQRMGDRASEVTRAVDSRRYMRMREGYCAALAIDSDTNRFTCTLYDVRPDVCRSLSPGSAMCLSEIREKVDLRRRCVDATQTRSKSF